jgi:hypothetical protein
VAGLIVDADTQYVAAEQKLEKLLETVPSQHRNASFVPHAKSIFHGEGKLREGWSWADRRIFLRSLVAIGPELGAPVCMGMVRRETPLDKSTGLSLTDYHHMFAFGLCVAHADRYVVERGRPNEVTTLVAENIPKKEGILRNAFQILKKRPLAVNMQHWTSSITEPPSIKHYSISTIRDTPHFVAKQGSPLLWIADACAFGFARYLSGGSFGAELIASVRTPVLDLCLAEPNRLIASGTVGGDSWPPKNKG